MFSVINLFKKLFHFIFSKSKNRNLVKFKKLRNIHQGEICYIFGDGNSIKNYDLKNFTTHKSFITKYLFTHKQFKYLNLKYCTCIEPFFFNYLIIFLLRFFRRKDFRRNLFNNLLFRYLIAKSYKKLISDNTKVSFFISFKNFFIKGKNIYKISEQNNSILNSFFHINKDKFDFNKNSTRLAISIASYMGFKKIYLIGFDYLEKNQIIGHWYENFVHINPKKNSFEHSFFKKIISKNKSKLIIINKSGKNNLLPCVSYKDFCKNNYNFINKRNMMKTKYLDMFKLTNQYKI